MLPSQKKTKTKKNFLKHKKLWGAKGIAAGKPQVLLLPGHHGTVRPRARWIRSLPETFSMLTKHCLSWQKSLEYDETDAKLGFSLLTAD